MLPYERIIALVFAFGLLFAGAFSANAQNYEAALAGFTKDSFNDTDSAISAVAASGNPLGDRNIQVDIRKGSLQLRPGDLFVCFTDGVVERANPSGKLFGDRRLRGTLTGQSLPDGRALVGLRDRLVAMLEQYAEGKLADDDITFVLCQFDPPVDQRRSSTGGRGAA